MAYIAAYGVTFVTGLETMLTKPFNPLLGETYELVTDEFRYFSEQVCHHPPRTAFHLEGKNYTVASTEI